MAESLATNPLITISVTVTLKVAVKETISELNINARIEEFSLKLDNVKNDTQDIKKELSEQISKVEQKVSDVQKGWD